MKEQQLWLSRILIGCSLLLLAGFLAYWLYDNYQREIKSLHNQASVEVMTVILKTMDIDIDGVIENLGEDVINSSNMEISLTIEDSSDIIPPSKTIEINHRDTHSQMIVVVANDSSEQFNLNLGNNLEKDSLQIRKQIMMLQGDDGKVKVDMDAIRENALWNIVPQFIFSLFLFGITAFTIILLLRNFREKELLLESKNNFISNMTHELKTPIATIGVALEAIQDFGVLDDREKTEAYLESSRHELNRLSVLVNQVLKISQLENEPDFYQFETISLKKIVEEVLIQQELLIEQHQAIVEIKDISFSDYLLKGDQIHLTNVLENIVVNALKYSDQGVYIKIELLETNDQIIVQIEDTGWGIPEAYQEKVFEKFFRVPTGDIHTTKGYGLGLSYVAKVVESHQGTIILTSKEGAGTCIKLQFPKEN